MVARGRKLNSSSDVSGEDSASLAANNTSSTQVTVTLGLVSLEAVQGHGERSSGSVSLTVSLDTDVRRVIRSADCNLKWNQELYYLKPE